MSTFKEFMNEIKESPNKAFSDPNTTLSTIQSPLELAVIDKLPTWLSISRDEKEKFSKEASNLVQDQAFLSKFSEKIGRPLENESEENFVKRSSDALRRMLYSKFGIS